MVTVAALEMPKRNVKRRFATRRRPRPPPPLDMRIQRESEEEEEEEAKDEFLYQGLEDGSLQFLTEMNT